MARRKSFSNMEKVLRLDLSQVLPPQVQKVHADFARKKLQEHLSGLKGTPPAVTTIVDGRRGASEDSVKPYGLIRYEFSWLAEVAQAALDKALEFSPVDSGEYRNSWFMMAGQVEIDPTAIPDGISEITITNSTPYHRKIQVGAMKMSVPPGIVERVRQWVLGRHGNLVDAQIYFIQLSGKAKGSRFEIPYILKGRRPARPAAQSRRSSAFRAGRKYLAARKDTAAGQQLTYPALTISLR